LPPRSTLITNTFPQTSKCLNYIDAPFVGPYFFVFMCVWAYLRHYLNLKILYSILTTFKTVGPFELNWETQQYKCWIAQYITFALLASLQAVNLFWFFLICRIAVRFILYKTADDDRSEYEPSEEETEEREKELKAEFNETADAAEGVLAGATALDKGDVKLRKGKAAS
jgi:acyl-CoA-dependent ceramide synthase